MTEPAALDCNQVVELVTDYLEGALGPADSAAFEAHLAECDDCVTYLEQIKYTAQVVQNVRPEHLPEATRAGLLAAFKDLHRAS